MAADAESGYLPLGRGLAEVMGFSHPPAIPAGRA